MSVQVREAAWEGWPQLSREREAARREEWRLHQQHHIASLHRVQTRCQETGHLCWGLKSLDSDGGDRQEVLSWQWLRARWQRR